jgi:hypothetical protein
MKPEDPGPLPNQAVRQDLRARYEPVIESGISNLQKTLELNPQYEDATAYMNLLIRERADLRETPEEYRQDIALADQWVQKAIDVKRQKAAQNSIQQAQPTPVRAETAPPGQTPR